jgi:hypothetical protein
VKFNYRFFATTCFCLFAFGIAAEAQDDRYKVKVQSPGKGKWIVEVLGTPTDHPDRVHGLAQYHAAKQALKANYPWFRITDTKKGIGCKISKDFGTVSGGAARVGNAVVGKKKAEAGFLDARKFAAEIEDQVLRIPNDKQKQKTQAAFITYCMTKQGKLEGGLY